MGGRDRARYGALLLSECGGNPGSEFWQEPVVCFGLILLLGLLVPHRVQRTRPGSGKDGVAQLRGH